MDADNSHKLSDKQVLWGLLLYITILVVLGFYVSAFTAILVFLFAVPLVGLILARHWRSSNVRGELAALIYVTFASFGSRIKRHPVISAIVVLLGIVIALSVTSQRPDVCSPDYISPAMDQAISSMCTTGLAKTEVQQAIDFADTQALSGHSIDTTADVLTIERYWYDRGLSGPLMRNFVAIQVRQDDELVDIESVDNAKQDSAAILQMAYQFALARSPSQTIRNTTEFAGAFLAIRSNSPDERWFSDFLANVNRYPALAFEKLSKAGLMHIAAIELSDPSTIPLITKFLNSPAYTNPSTLFCKTPDSNTHQILGICR